MAIRMVPETLCIKKTLKTGRRGKAKEPGLLTLFPFKGLFQKMETGHLPCITFGQICVTSKGGPRDLQEIVVISPTHCHFHKSKVELE